MRLLLIEDEPLLRQQLARQLLAEGFRVDEAEDGETGLYNAREYPCDLAIVDLGLPRLSGMELIRQLRAGGSLLPILILTARGRWQDKVEGLEAGADDYLTKPFEFPELLARVKALLRRSAGAPSAHASPLAPPRSRPHPTSPTRSASPRAAFTILPPRALRRP